MKENLIIFLKFSIVFLLFINSVTLETSQQSCASLNKKSILECTKQRNKNSLCVKYQEIFNDTKCLDLSNITLKTIDSFDPKIRSCTKFQEILNETTCLDLSNNKLKRIRSGNFQRLSNLRILDLSNNRLKMIDHNAFRGLPNLKIIDLSGNNLKNVDLTSLVSTSVKVFLIPGCAVTSLSELSNCTKTENKQERKRRVKNLKALFKTSKKLSNRDIAKAIKELKNVLSTDALNDTDTVEDVADVLNEISASNVYFFSRENAKTVLESLDLFASKIPVMEKKFQLTRPNMAIGIVNLMASGRGFSHYSMSGVGDAEINETNVGFENNEDENNNVNNLIGFIRLPQEVILNAENDRIHFKIILSAKLFVSATDILKKSFINSAVLSASVSSRQVVGLKKHVVVQLRHSQPMSKQSRIRCVFWKENEEKWSDEGCLTKETLNRSTVCSCNHLTNFALLMDIYDTKEQLKYFGLAFQIITYVGCSLSLLGLLITLLTYGSLYLKCNNKKRSRDFRTLRKDTFSQVIFCLSLTIFIANIVFLGGTWHQENDIRCKVLASLLHFLFLSVMCWTAVESVYLYMTCIKVIGSKVSKFILKAALCAWGIPLIVVAVTLGINVDNYIFNQICWLDRFPFYGAFLAPIALILLANVFIFCAVIYQRRRQTEVRIAHGASNYSVGTQIRGTIGLSFILGLTWLFAAFAIGAVAVPFHILFALFNSLQGFMIFIFYCVLKKDIRKYWSSCCRCFKDEEYQIGTGQSSSRKYSRQMRKGLFKPNGKRKAKPKNFEENYDLKGTTQTTDFGNPSLTDSRETF